MGQNDGLLLDSDDSDIPDLDLPAPNNRKRRTKLFSKTRQSAEAVITQRTCCSVQGALVLLLFTVVIAIAFLGIFASYVISQLDELRNDPRHGVATREIEILKREVNRIKVDIDMLRLVSASPGTPTWNVSSILNTRLEHIETQINDVVLKIQEKLNEHPNDDAFNLLSERVNAVAEACIQGCGAVSKLIPPSNGTRHALNAPNAEKPKKKRSKAYRSSFARDTPIIFTRSKKL